jgi:hypothetical protein
MISLSIIIISRWFKRHNYYFILINQVKYFIIQTCQVNLSMIILFKVIVNTILFYLIF